MANATDWKSTYRHDTLDHSLPQIRLLTLFPAEDKSADIHGSLNTVSLPLENREYEALSYTWGDQSIKHPLFIGEDMLKITQNLSEALRRLRHRHEPRTLWIDAVCINQAENTERNHQVRQMRDIYANASKVLVWLGESDEDTDQAMEFLQDSEENRNQREKPLVGLEKIYNRHWWLRMWVVQEVFVAKTEPLVICGDKCAPWEAVRVVLIELSADQIFVKKTNVLTDPMSMAFFTSLPYQRRSKQRSVEKELSLEYLLLGTCNREASDPRDHVYALLGLVSDHRDERLEPDYTKPAALAYQNAMVSVIKSRQSLEWLVYAVEGDASVKPSWCIDFSAKSWFYKARLKEGAVKGAASTGREEFEILHDPGSGTIRLAGTEIGRIDTVHKSTCGAFLAEVRVDVTVSSEEALSTLRDIIGAILDDTSLFSLSAHTALEKRLGRDEASKKLAAGDVWKVAAGGVSFNELSDQEGGFELTLDGYAFLEKIAQMNELRQIVSGEWAHLLPEAPSSFEDTAVDAYIDIAYRASDSYFFITDTGYIGRAGDAIQNGDVLCILFGCDWPAVLRSQEDGSYKLVTFTYTDGVMEGEFLRENSSVEEKEFLLR
ncbi:hypothetical protein H2201_003542 [Coniosporium apollinis]|uniref:Heterokaryon incompatibility domain-containing protein n=2 Tax=Coniosporium TaxID=2810619 RepID=A0ABQ9NVD8_9PEZI|nr:hypothetical protein H2199_008051 [Cladosporium sp. JES 115]KAJ9666354.1 hypothetical protein H2201_003542 [Coniosporium apollinis]